MNDTLSTLLEKIKELYNLNSATGILSWDQETFMPQGGGAYRAEVLSTLSKIYHQKITSPDFIELLETYRQQSDTLSPKLQAIVREKYVQCKRYQLIPEDLNGAILKASSLAQQAWVEARKNKSTQDFLPHLHELVGLKKEYASCLRELYGQEATAYDVLMDVYEPGLKEEFLKDLFGGLKTELVDLLRKLQSVESPIKKTLDSLNFNTQKQDQWCKHILDKIGFDSNRGRLDIAAHPFTQGCSYQDVRLTTRYHEKSLLDAISSTLHEGGHGLYEQGLNDGEYPYSPMTEAASLGVHESQSRFWENHIGGSFEFWKFAYPSLQITFPTELKGISLDDFYAIRNKVQPSFIRVEADEVTYNMHIILRFEMESRLFSGDLAVSDVEEAWNKESQTLLGITPSHCAEGFMQDVHWSCGLFGYFPTYSLGNLYAAQIFDALEKESPDLNKNIEKADFKSIHQFLSEKIWKHGQLYAPLELMKKATGMELNQDCFVKYLKKKYFDLYSID